MNRSELQEEYNTLELRQIALVAIMAESDAYACQCTKTGENFQELYPEKYEGYCSAREEWHVNKARMAEIQELLNNNDIE